MHRMRTRDGTRTVTVSLDPTRGIWRARGIARSGTATARVRTAAITMGVMSGPMTYAMINGTTWSNTEFTTDDRVDYVEALESLERATLDGVQRHYGDRGPDERYCRHYLIVEFRRYVHDVSEHHVSDAGEQGPNRPRQERYSVEMPIRGCPGVRRPEPTEGGPCDRRWRATCPGRLLQNAPRGPKRWLAPRTAGRRSGRCRGEP